VKPAVTLRRATAVDAKVLHAIRSEPSARQFQPLRQVPIERLERMLADRAEAVLNRDFDGKAQWVIEVDGEPAGWITLDVTSREHGVASVGYTVSETFRGRGVATAALIQLVSLAFARDGLNLSRLEAIAAVDNHASRRVLQKAGFHEEGVAKHLLVINGVRVDHVRFGLVRENSPR
jgi:ribosomal-protein-alanine N-acetyltransferase